MNASTSGDLQSLKALRKRQVVDTATAKTIGTVRAAALDPATSKVLGLVVKGDAAGTLPLDGIINIGADAVTVVDRSAVQTDAATLPTDADARGRRVLDEGGTALGKLDDLLMTEDGLVAAVVIDGAQVDRRLLGVGGYAVVVTRD